jgi:salicylate hydroxylase
MSTDCVIRIAIIGGGLAGAILINALLQHSHLHVEIFEYAPEFSERGAAVGIAQNGQAALTEVGGDVATALDRARAVVMSSSRMYMVRFSEALEKYYRAGIPLIR